MVEGVPPAQVLAGVRQNAALFFEEYPARTVNNVYFDTPELRNYHQNVDGNRDRVKVRIRWYGSLFGLIRHPVLEIKRKRGLLGTKDSAPLPPFELQTRVGGAQIQAWVRGSPLPAMLRRELDPVEPVLLNRYRRHYFRSADRRLRLTVDTNLEFYHMAPHQHSVVHRVQAWPFVVVELKYDDRDHTHAAEALNGLPFRLHRMSKYVFGINLLRS